MNKMVSTFTSEMPSSHIFMIMGARGNGKTVLMSAATGKLMEEKDWLHVDISPESDMMTVLASRLYQKTKKKYAKIKFDVNIDLKFASVGAATEENEKYSSVYTDLDSMLEKLRDKNIKVLITVDEAINSKTMREFTSFFQHCRI